MAGHEKRKAQVDDDIETLAELDESFDDYLAAGESVISPETPARDLKAKARAVQHACKHIAHIAVQAEDVLRTFATEQVDARARESNRPGLLIDQNINRAVACEDICAERCDHEHRKKRESYPRGPLLQKRAERAPEGSLWSRGLRREAHELTLTRGSRYA